MSSYIVAIDQGTTSSRFIVFDKSGRIVSTAQAEHEQIYPRAGWVEHDAEEIWRRTQEVIAEAMRLRGFRPQDLAAIGSAYAAGLAVGYFEDLHDLRANWAADHTWTPQMNPQQRDDIYRLWKRAVTKSFDWTD